MTWLSEYYFLGSPSLVIAFLSPLKLASDCPVLGLLLIPMLTHFLGSLIHVTALRSSLYWQFLNWCFLPRLLLWTWGNESFRYCSALWLSKAELYPTKSYPLFNFSHFLGYDIRNNDIEFMEDTKNVCKISATKLWGTDGCDWTTSSLSNDLFWSQWPTDCEVAGFLRNSEGNAYTQLLLSGMLCLILCASVYDLDSEKQIKIVYIVLFNSTKII